MNVTGTANGFALSNSGSIANSFWDSSKSGVTSGEVIGQYEALSTADMTTATNFTGAGWSVDAWYIEDGIFPIIRQFDR